MKFHTYILLLFGLRTRLTCARTCKNFHTKYFLTNEKNYFSWLSGKESKWSLWNIYEVKYLRILSFEFHLWHCLHLHSVRRTWLKTHFSLKIWCFFPNFLFIHNLICQLFYNGTINLAHDPIWKRWIISFWDMFKYTNFRNRWIHEWIFGLQITNEYKKFIALIRVIIC